MNKKDIDKLSERISERLNQYGFTDDSKNIDEGDLFTAKDTVKEVLIEFFK